MTAEEQVAVLKESMFEYLDAVRESGVTDILGVGPYLEAEFGLTRSEAKAVLESWMLTYAERHPLPGEEQP